MKTLPLIAFLAILSAMAPWYPVLAATCPEGSVDGKCVNPRLARAAREGAVAVTESRLSVSSHDYAPSLDTDYAYPDNVSGAMQFGSERSAKGAIQPVPSSAPAIVYGIRN